MTTFHQYWLEDFIYYELKQENHFNKARESHLKKVRRIGICTETKSDKYDKVKSGGGNSEYVVSCGGKGYIGLEDKITYGNRYKLVNKINEGIDGQIFLIQDCKTYSNYAMKL